MGLFQEQMLEYKKQLEKGHIQEAYQGLMSYIMSLKTHFKNKYPQYSVPSSIYYGYMDMTYFSLFPESLKERKLKIAVVFIHETYKFEVWLSGSNKKIQNKYWELFKKSKCNNYHIPADIKGLDSIVERVLVENPDFSDLDELTEQIEKGILQFIHDIEEFLSLKNSLVRNK